MSHCRSEPAPSPRTKTRVMTTPATVSSCIWTLVMRFSSSWMVAKPTAATATNTAPSQASSSMPTEGQEPRWCWGRVVKGVRLYQIPPGSQQLERWTLPIATDLSFRSVIMGNMSVASTHPSTYRGPTAADQSDFEQRRRPPPHITLELQWQAVVTSAGGLAVIFSSHPSCPMGLLGVQPCVCMQSQPK